MHNMRNVMAALMALLLMVLNAGAQTTGTNMITLMDDNITNAQNTLVPLGIGLTVLFISIAIGVKVFRKTVK